MTANRRKHAEPGELLWVETGRQWSKRDPIRHELAKVERVGRKYIRVDGRDYEIETGHGRARQGFREGWAGGECEITHRILHHHRHKIARAVEECDALALLEVARAIGYKIPNPEEPL